MAETTKKILVAEDNDTNYEVVKELLKGDGIEILWAKNGQEAVEMYKNNKDIDIILMDIQMPVMNGVDAAKEIKELNQDIPIIGVSAFDKMMFSETNLDAYIQKPFLPNKLLVMIDDHMKKIYDEILKREDEREKKWLESEKETLRILNGVAELLELTDRVNKTETDNVMNKLEEIKKILNGKIKD